jgi:hypothetical protein
MSLVDQRVGSQREGRAKAQTYEYGLTAEVDPLGDAYVVKGFATIARDAFEYNCEETAGEISICDLADEQVRMHNEKGKYVFLLLDAAYVTIPMGLDQRYTCEYWQIGKALHRRLVESLRSRWIPALPHQAELSFEAGESFPLFGEEMKERFHALLDKKLMKDISPREEEELAGLEGIVHRREFENIEGRSLEEHWANRFDKAIGSLEGINEKLEKLLTAEK